MIFSFFVVNNILNGIEVVGFNVFVLEVEIVILLVKI